MTYLVLARKYRPTTFSQVVGQELVTRTLRGAIEERRIAHAYLFSGPRGTGKTTSARIFAKALNCERGPTAEPCGECERCRAVDAGNETDLIEIDAASNTGVDNVRELRSQAVYAPMRARFKVYLIDEVHMLSKPAFNALLKTLEEPPPHVKFLFATTEPQKIPDTILSRCQVLRLMPLTEEAISGRLKEVFAAEGVRAGEGVAEELARRARGGLRDALSLADQLLSLVGPEPQAADVERLTGDGPQTLRAILDALAEGERAAVLAALPGQEGGEGELVSALLDELRACMLAALCGPEAVILARPGEAGRELAARGKRIGARRVELWLTELLHLRERMRALPAHGRLLLEVTLLDLCDSAENLALGTLAQRLAELEARVGGEARVPAAGDEGPGPQAAASSTLRVPSSRPPTRPAPSSPAPGTGKAASRQGTWKAFLADLRARASALADVVERRGEPAEIGSDRTVVSLVGLTDDERLLIEDRRNQALCSKALQAVTGVAGEMVFQDTTKARPAAADEFTTEVADLFGGRAEE